MVERAVSDAPLARVLVVDDESILVTALCQILTAEGYSATGAASGPDALAALRVANCDAAARFDVLITDLMMPAMDGIALLLAAQEIDRDLVSIIMTGHGTIDTAVEAMKGGALDYILKPFRLNVVMPVLSRASAVRRLRLQNTVLQQQVAQRTAQLEAANLELLRANKELEAFTHTVSHDLRQPLTGVIGFSELLISGKAGALNATQKAYLGDIHEGGQRLLRLTEDLLQFSRLAQSPLGKQSVNVESLVSEIVRSLRNGEPHRTVDVRVGPLAQASADPSLLRQVFVNLLANAFKFTRYTPNPVIEITSEERPGEHAYRIRDNGAGFDMTHAQRLFSIFQRLHGDSEFEGTGLGLSIVQRIIERHGGTISAQAAVGKGATFRFSLPA